MIKLFKNNLFIFCTYFVLLSISLYFIFSFSKTDIHLYINQFVGNPILNNFFYYITYLGDGNVAVIILLIILTYNVRLGIYTTSSFLTASLFSIFLKEVLFDDENRPSFIFNFFEHKKLNLVEGVEMFIHNSFPSGHSTQAFGIFMCLVFYTKNNLLKFIFFSLALFTAISRVYLSQHWLIDVTVGSIIGLCFSIIFYFVFMQTHKFDKLNMPFSKINFSDFKSKK